MQTFDAAILYPENEQELRRLIADHRGGGLVPCGGGSKLHWGVPFSPKATLISTDRLCAIQEHRASDLVITVEAGRKLRDLQGYLHPQGQFWPVDPSYGDRATIGGIVATADAGSLRHRYGGIRDLILGLSWVNGEGEVAKAGGKVVKNVAGYDLMKLFTGSFGTLGLLHTVTLRLYPLPETSETVLLSGSPEALAVFVLQLRRSPFTPTAADWLNGPLMQALNLGEGAAVAIRCQGLAAGVGAQIAGITALARTCGLTPSVPGEALWDQLQDIFSPGDRDTLRLKLGIQPTAMGSWLQTATREIPDLLVRFHLGSGLGQGVGRYGGRLRQLRELRQACQIQQGFLSVLAAPPALKPQFDPWGYGGNGGELMGRLRSQLDPRGLWSPGRSVI